MLDTFIANTMARINLVIVYVLAIAFSHDFGGATLFGIYLTFRYSAVAFLIESASYISEGDIACGKIE